MSTARPWLTYTLTDTLGTSGQMTVDVDTTLAQVIEWYGMGDDPDVTQQLSNLLTSLGFKDEPRAMLNLDQDACVFTGIRVDPNRSDSARVESLRGSVAGIYPSEAAVELLVRFAGGRFAGPGYPWIAQLEDGRYVLDEEQITEPNIAALSGGEAKVLRIVASLAGGTENSMYLHEVLPGLGRHELDLVLAAIAHAAGSHDDRVMGTRQGRRSDTGEIVDVAWPTKEQAGSLHPWPNESP